jgi:hypothetical protein
VNFLRLRICANYFLKENIIIIIFVLEEQDVFCPVGRTLFKYIIYMNYRLQRAALLLHHRLDVSNGNPDDAIKFFVTDAVLCIFQYFDISKEIIAMK